MYAVKHTLKRTTKEDKTLTDGVSRDTCTVCGAETYVFTIFTQKHTLHYSRPHSTPELITTLPGYRIGISVCPLSQNALHILLAQKKIQKKEVENIRLTLQSLQKYKTDTYSLKIFLAGIDHGDISEWILDIKEKHPIHKIPGRFNIFTGHYGKIVFASQKEDIFKEIATKFFTLFRELKAQYGLTYT